MSTKPPPPVAEFAADSLEKLAYSIASEVPARESNDRNRLGFQIWAWLKEPRGTIERAVTSSGARTEQPLDEVAAYVKRRLEERGMKS